MVEVACDWNYENPGIYVKALSFFTRGARAIFPLANSRSNNVAGLWRRLSTPQAHAFAARVHEKPA